MSKMEVERTLVLFKPDTVQRGLVGEILTRFERVGLKIVGTKMIFPDRDHYYRHYEDIGHMVTRRGQETFDITLEMMQLGPVIAMVLEGVESVSLVRKMVGGTVHVGLTRTPTASAEMRGVGRLGRPNMAGLCSASRRRDNPCTGDRHRASPRTGGQPR